MKNTKRRGRVDFFVYKEKNHYVGVCLTFDIIEEGNDPKKLMASLHEAAFLHLKTVIKNNLSDELLNRYAPKKYWDRYNKFLENKAHERAEKAVQGAIKTYANSRAQEISFAC